MFGSIRLSVHLYICLFHGLGLPGAKENHHDRWNTVHNLSVFVSNQGKSIIQIFDRWFINKIIGQNIQKLLIFAVFLAHHYSKYP